MPYTLNHIPFFYLYTRPEQGVIWFMLLLPGSVEMDKEISESEVFDIRKGEETLAAKAMVTLMAVHRDKLALK